MPTALIWGASGGIGQALVRRLKDDGWWVFGAARDPSRIPADVDGEGSFEAADPASIDSLMMMVAQSVDALDLVVYAAGGLQAGPLRSLTAASWMSVLESNLSGARRVAAASLPLLREGGHMVFFGAYGDHLILPKMGAYACAKAGLEPMVRILAKENRGHKFTLVRPGAVDTPFWSQAPFSLPKNSKTAGNVAAAVLAHILAGASGELNL